MAIGRLIRGTLRRAHDEERGQVLIFFAMFIVTVGLAMGVVAVDASFWHSERRRVQAAADAAALAAAQDIPSGDATVIGNTALKYAQLDGYDPNTEPNVTVTTHFPPQTGEHVGDHDYVEVIIDSPSAGFFVGAFSGVLAPHHGARAVARWDDSSTNARAAACGLYVLENDPTNNNDVETLFVNGAGSLEVENSCLQVNSADTGEAAEIEGPGNITTGAGPNGTRVVGRCVVAGGSTGKFIPKCTHPPAAPDPLTGVPAPPAVGAPSGLPSGCAGAPPVCNLTGPTSLEAGVYKTINAQSGTVTLNPGIYVITGTLGGNGVIDASSGVTVYFGCSTGSGSYYRACQSGDSTNVMGSLALTNGGRLTINAPTSAGCTANGTCDYKGMALFYDALNKDDVRVKDNSSLNVTGTIYAPAAWLRDDSDRESSLRSLVIVDKLNLSGDGDLTITYDPKENYALPGAVLTE